MKLSNSKSDQVNDASIPKPESLCQLKAVSIPVRSELPAPYGQAHGFVAVDFTDWTAVRDRAREHVAANGPVHILLNNTGGPPAGPVFEAEAENLLAAFTQHIVCNQALIQATAPGMREAGYGRIVNMSSTLGSLTEVTDPDSEYAGVETPAYRLSKAALNAITTLVAKQVRNENILVNSVCPGWVKTDMGGDQAPLSPEQGADTPLWLATLSDDGPSGGFYRERIQIPW